MDRYETVAKVLRDKRIHSGHCNSDAIVAEVLREHFPEPGRCGECRWWSGSGFDHKSLVYCTHEKTPPCLATMACNSCPLFEAKPDKYEELARELHMVWQQLRIGENGIEAVLPILRERVTVREGE